MKDIRITVVDFEDIKEGEMGKVIKVCGGAELYDLLGDDAKNARIQTVEVWEGDKKVRKTNYLGVDDTLIKPIDPLDVYVDSSGSPMTAALNALPTPGMVYCSHCGFPPANCICSPPSPSPSGFCRGCGHHPGSCRCNPTPGVLVPNNYCTTCGYLHPNCVCALPVPGSIIIPTCPHCYGTPCSGATSGCGPKSPPITGSGGQP